MLPMPRLPCPALLVVLLLLAAIPAAAAAEDSSLRGRAAAARAKPEVGSATVEEVLPGHEKDAALCAQITAQLDESVLKGTGEIGRFYAVGSTGWGIKVPLRATMGSMVSGEANIEVPCLIKFKEEAGFDADILPAIAVWLKMSDGQKVQGVIKPVVKGSDLQVLGPQSKCDEAAPQVVAFFRQLMNYYHGGGDAFSISDIKPANLMFGRPASADPSEADRVIIIDAFCTDYNTDERVFGQPAVPEKEVESLESAWYEAYYTQSRYYKAFGDLGPEYVLTWKAGFGKGRHKEAPNRHATVNRNNRIEIDRLETFCKRSKLQQEAAKAEASVEVAERVPEPLPIISTKGTDQRVLSLAEHPDGSSWQRRIDQLSQSEEQPGKSKV